MTITIKQRFLLLKRVTYSLVNLMEAVEALTRKIAHTHTPTKFCIWGLLLPVKME